MHHTKIGKLPSVGVAQTDQWGVDDLGGTMNGRKINILNADTSPRRIWNRDRTALARPVSMRWPRDCLGKLFSGIGTNRQESLPSALSRHLEINPSQNQAAAYAATLHYLRASAAVKRDSKLAVNGGMRKLPVRDFKSLKSRFARVWRRGFACTKEASACEAPTGQILRCRRCLLRQEFVSCARSAQF
jgi:hypothetical protein